MANILCAMKLAIREKIINLFPLMFSGNQGEDNKLVPSYVLWRFVKYAVVLINDKFCGNIRILTAMMLGCT